MNKNESKYFNTAILMDEALISLLYQKNIEYITIKEICEKAGVNRSTFYLHYETINDLLNETLEYINNKFINHFKSIHSIPIENIDFILIESLDFIKEDYLEPYLSFIQENKIIFKASFSNSIEMKIQEKYRSLEKYLLNPILKRYDVPENKRKYINSFYIQGIIGIVKQWIEHECEDDIKDIIDIIIQCVKK
ncbi:TetR/AcrR family transcriptional regulator [Beduini massiliensis]|uniref:TetR/AcrR family transcriptional regulator n=1 Tax=Beduini massiliensis TaxID=1585974 RepID=UPI00059A8701|nr:TetR/AcrR family transcriptional regulator [Beduini massiliensis]